MAVVRRVSETDAVAWLAASPHVQLAKEAVQHTFPSIASRVPSSAASQVYTQGFDFEQIWQQIDLQETPLGPSFNRWQRRLESANPDIFFSTPDANGFQHERDQVEAAPVPEVEPQQQLQQSTTKAKKGKEHDRRVSPSSDGGKDAPQGASRAFEDSFLRLSEMEKFLDQAEAEDEGLEDGPGRLPVSAGDDEDEGDMDDAFDFTAKLAEREDLDDAEQPRYQDFFGASRLARRKADAAGSAEGVEDEENAASEDEEEDGFQDMDGSEDGELEEEQQEGAPAKGPVSAHEKRLAKMQERIKELEQANLGDKHWTLRGEVSASTRPYRSLEMDDDGVPLVDLDFEQRARPAPVVTEEGNKSIEDIIRSRIMAAQFDDVERNAPPAPVASKVQIELDEEKSKKGLGEIYEAEYVQKTSGLTVAPNSSLEKEKEEARLTFKRLCAKLDALSHFHFVPKPAVQDLAVRADVPALAMEEVAPVAVAEASMLAPEEIFAGKGAIKAEAELTHEDRQRRRATKKRKRRLARKVAQPFKKQTAPARPLKRSRPSAASGNFGKSSKVFAGLEQMKG